MKKAVRFLALTLAVLMLLAVAVACGDTPPEKTPDTTVAKPEQTDDGKFHPEHYIPGDDLGDYEFRILSPIHDWAIMEMTYDSITGDLINDAIYARQKSVEELLHVKLSQENNGSPISKLQTTAALSGEDAFDVALTPTYDALTLFLEGYTVDQSTISSIHLHQPWWEERFNSEVNLRNKRYITFGNASMIYYCSFYLFAFNKRMVENYCLEMPYDLVESGDWTWDKAFEMMKVVATDTDGDGLSTPATDADILGLTGHVNHCRNVMFSSGFTICEQDAEGNITFNGLSENYIDAYDKFLKNFLANPACAFSGLANSRFKGYETTPGVKDYIDLFVKGRALFHITGPMEVTTIRESQNEYGIVVVPKYSKEQQNYITPVYSATSGFVVPVASGDVERTGKVLEALCAFSYKNIVDKHISVVLHFRVAQDPTAIKMINLAYASGAIDVSMANNFGTCTSLLNNLHVQVNDGVSRVFNSVKTMIQNDIKGKLEKLDAMD